MNPSLRPISELLRTERGQHRIPFFQRNYAWDEQKIKLFLDFIFDISENGIGHETNFIGFMVTEPPERASGLSSVKFNVIDGQQRLTTFSLIIIGLCKLALERIQELEVKVQQAPVGDKKKKLVEAVEFYKQQIDDIKFKYLENKIFFRSPFFDDRLKFVPQDVNRNTYLKIYNHEDLSGVNDDNLKRAYKVIFTFLRKNLKDKSEEKTEENFLKFLAAAEDLKVVQLELSAGDDPQKMFETINDRGKKLSTVDLIRNTVFTPSREMQITEEDTMRWYNDFWKDTDTSFNQIPSRDEDVAEKEIFNFVRSLLMRNGEYITTKGLNSFFNINYRSKESRLEFLASFKKLCNPYISIVGLHPTITESTIEKESDLRTSLKRLQDLDFLAVNPFLLKLFENSIPQSEIRNVVNLFERYFVRRSICAESVKVLPKIITRLCKEYQENFPKGNNITVSKWINDEFKLDQQNIPEERIYSFPTDYEVKKSLTTADMYSQSPDLVKYILLRVNEDVMKKEFPGKVEKLQIEHVMPQKLSVEWENYLQLAPNDLKVMHEECVGLIGNLALTRNNQNMSNSPFILKKPFLAQSPYILTNQLGGNQFTGWYKKEIHERNTYIIDLITKILPDLS